MLLTVIGIQLYPFSLASKQECRTLLYMSRFNLHNHLRKSCVLAAATLILPALAFAGHDKGKGNDGRDNGKGNDQHIPLVPEANAGWVLIPFLGLVLVFSARQFFPKKATK